MVAPCVCNANSGVEPGKKRIGGKSASKGDDDIRQGDPRAASKLEEIRVEMLRREDGGLPQEDARR
ncbi:hypothetical protein HPP92_029047 [Vanilla planifolia]|uniref:Uncharacterized protein n=1 Tax=Vanilla planifolia TaxID=51239 RepID=A0A835P3U8_VANPL|nr:hypothetical protein HPP92_029047 [Vanilla planifolia]KAG0446040.1 hypothetical protein HPP92_029036 [Vanilla planifolia]